MTGERILRIGITAAGVIALAVFVITKSAVLMALTTGGMNRHGDLYRLAKVSLFRTDIPPSLCDEPELIDGDPDSTPVIIIGDSFLVTCKGHDPFPQAVSARLNEDVTSVYAGNDVRYFNPLFLCWKNHLASGHRRIVLLERTERYVLTEYGDPFPSDTNIFRRSAARVKEGWWNDVRRHWFTRAETNYSIFFANCDAITPVIEFWNTWRFRLFGIMSDETPVYSLNPPFLFYEEETRPEKPTSFYYPHPDSTIETIASNIALLGKKLRERYHAELVFMPVPGPYTLYHRFINNDRYDGFLPRLCRRLEAKHIPTVQLYDAFMNSGEILYFPTDTHWNAAGARIAVDKAVSVLAPMLDQ